MANTLLLKSNSTAGAVPTTSTVQKRELAINTADGILYTQTAAGVIKAINPAFGQPPLTVSLDMGSIPMSAQTFTSTVTGAAVGMNVLATVSGSNALGSLPDELEMEPMIVSAQVVAANTIYFTIACTDMNLMTVGKKVVTFYLG